MSIIPAYSLSVAKTHYKFINVSFRNPGRKKQWPKGLHNQELMRILFVKIGDGMCYLISQEAQTS